MPKPKFQLTSVDTFINRAKTVSELESVHVRLAELSPDLSMQLFMNVAVAGLEARNDTTRASAVIAAGVQQWLKTVEGLRTLLSDKLWKIHDERNCPFISTPDRSMSIVVMTGCSETGRISYQDPTNQAEKGAVAQGFVQANRQLEMFLQDAFTLTKALRNETQVWVLLYHYDKSSNEVRLELSYPTGFDKRKITGWGERIIIGSVPNNPADFTIRRDTPNSPPTVDVAPKSGTHL